MVRPARIPARERGDEITVGFPRLWFPRSSVGTHTDFSALVGIQSCRYAFPRGSVGTRSRGFTLLEMLLVIFLMALVASTGLMLTDGVEDQAKYDETKQRMELIRKAIVGDPTRTVNGSPEISGFVADMGRLPGCLRELLEIFPDPDNAGKFLSPCDGVTEIPLFSFDTNSSLWAGWRGPYLFVQPDRDGVKRFRDGYGNEDIDEDGAGTADDNDDAQNFGWIWQLYKVDRITPTTDPAEALLIRIKSKGFDGREGSADDYPDFPIDNVEPLVDKFDYEVNFQNWDNLAIAFENTSGVARHISTDTLRLILAFTGGEYESDLFPDSDVSLPTQNGVVGVTGAETATVPAGTTLVGTTLTFVTNGVIAFNNGSVSVTVNDTVIVPTGTSLSSTTLTFAAGNVVFAKGATTLNIVPQFKDPVTSNPAVLTPAIYGQFSLRIVCDSSDTLFDGDCSDDGDANGHNPLSQPWIFNALPRSSSVLPPSPLIWRVQ